MTNEEAINVLRWLNPPRANKKSFDDFNQATDIAIKALERQRWIPVSKRLPKEGEVVLTQAKFKDDVKMAVSSRIDYNYWTTWGTRDINIVAWRPLPEPYQGVER